MFLVGLEFVLSAFSGTTTMAFVADRAKECFVGLFQFLLDLEFVRTLVLVEILLNGYFLSHPGASISIYLAQRLHKLCCTGFQRATPALLLAGKISKKCQGHVMSWQEGNGRCCMKLVSWIVQLCQSSEECESAVMIEAATWATQRQV
jgi:hypothetical protein